MIKDALKTLTLRQNLTAATAETVMNEIMNGQASDIEITAYLVALAVKNESVPEIVGSAQAMIQHALAIESAPDAMDIVGTGGDFSNTFNISTTAAFIVSAAGVPVAKHGNRAASSKSGTADALEALGVKIDLTPAQASAVLQQTGQTFLFARSYHPAMKYVAPIRAALGVRTVFNILGPLTNPSRPQTMLLGVYAKHLLRPLAAVLAQLGVTNALLVRGQDGLDEVTLTTATDVVELRDGVITEFVFDPRAYGFTLTKPANLTGGTPVEKAQITHGILAGELTDAKRDVTLLNAGLALYAARPALGIAGSIAVARQTLASGEAFAQYQAVQTASQAVGQLVRGNQK